LAIRKKRKYGRLFFSLLVVRKGAMRRCRFLYADIRDNDADWSKTIQKYKNARLLRLQNRSCGCNREVKRGCFVRGDSLGWRSKKKAVESARREGLRRRNASEAEFGTSPPVEAPVPAVQLHFSGP
jgi:hypothetical protein